MNLDTDTAAFMGGLIVRITLAAIFAQSALHALRNIATHMSTVEQYRLLPKALVAPFAACLPVVLLATAVALLIPAAATLGACAGVALLLLFTCAMAINLLRGRKRIDCGCGGGDGQQLSRALVARNLLLAILLAAAAAAPSVGPVDPVLLISTIGCASAGVSLYFAANALLRNAEIML